MDISGQNFWDIFMRFGEEDNAKEVVAQFLKQGKLKKNRNNRELNKIIGK